MAGLKVAESKEELEERAPDPRKKFPYNMRPFPYSLARVSATKPTYGQLKRVKSRND